MIGIEKKLLNIPFSSNEVAFMSYDLSKKSYFIQHTFITQTKKKIKGRKMKNFLKFSMEFNTTKETRMRGGWNVLYRYILYSNNFLPYFACSTPSIHLLFVYFIILFAYHSPQLKLLISNYVKYLAREILLSLEFS